MENHQEETADSGKSFIAENLDELSLVSKAGVTVTAMYLAGLSWWMYEKWEKFSAMDPNSWGDFLAGTFGPLAFLWLVLGYFQQGHELRQNSEALKLQARELKNSVEQQKDIALATKRQLFQLLENHRAHIELTADVMLSHNANKHYLVEFKLKNNGYRCRDLWMYIPECGRHTTTQYFQDDAINIESFGTNEIHTEFFYFLIPDTQIEESITIKYIDGTGEQKSIQWDFYRGQDYFSLASKPRSKSPSPTADRPPSAAP